MSAHAVDERAAAFARAVAAKRLTSKEHCEECVKIAHDLARRGKPLPIEEIFVRKGYLKKPEAVAISRSLASWGHAAPASAPAPTPSPAKTSKPAPRPEPAHEKAPSAYPAPRPARRKCPACEKDPGQGTDSCSRCGADLETGAPGPQATTCTACRRVIKRNAAVCPYCAVPLERGHHRRRSAVPDLRVWIDRLVVLAALAGCFYFLIYKKGIAPLPAPAPEEAPAPPTPVQTAQQALEKGDVKGAATALEGAVQAPDHDPALDVPFLIAERRAGRPISKAAVKRARAAAPNDPAVLLLAAEVALDDGDAEDALRALEKVPASFQQDDYFRSRARLADAKKDEPGALAALEKIKERTEPEGRRLAQAALVQGTLALEDRQLETARAAFERAVVLAPAYVPARVRLGTVLIRMDKLGLAKQEFDKARELAPLDVGAALGTAIVLDRSGEKDAAIKAYREFIDRAEREQSHEKEVKVAAARVQALEGK